MVLQYQNFVCSRRLLREPMKKIVVVPAGLVAFRILSATLCIGSTGNIR